MSSFFDTMARCADSPQQVFELAKRQYRAYLEHLRKECLSREASRVEALIILVEAIRSHPETYGDEAPQVAIQDMHDLAHQVGSAAIKLRGGRQATDNPHLPYFTY